MLKPIVTSWCVVFLLALTLCGCGGKRYDVSLAEEGAGMTPLNQDSLTLVSHAMAPYRFGFGDAIEIKFFYNPELDEELTVRPDGMITLPRLGDLFVVGLTPAQLDDIITAKYAEILRDPDITVIVQNFASQVVYVLGEVGVPGGYDLTVNMTTIQSVALAGGFTERANASSVILIRATGAGAEAERVDLADVISSGRLVDDHVLKPFDIVYVPNNFIDKVDIFMQKYFEGLLPPFNLWLRGWDAAHPEERAIRTR
jgi:protein involved in polysaccharide export with SLBB domain